MLRKSKGHLGFGRLGVILPETGSSETESVMLDLLKSAADANLKIAGEALVYPDRDPRDATASELAERGELIFREGSKSAAPLAIMLPEFPRWKRCLDVLGASCGLIVSETADDYHEMHERHEKSRSPDDMRWPHQDRRKQ